MKLNFKRVKLENFLSIGQADIDLQDRGFTLIKGINNNPVDLAKSNGSGKSSITEAIIWALTGETVRGIKDVVNMFTEGGTAVELQFDVDSDEYVIIRYKEHKKYKSDLKIFVNGQDKSGKGIRDSQKLLESYLPDLTASLLGSVVVLGQGLPQRFTNNTPVGRKEVLEKLSKSDYMIDDLKRRLADRKTYLSTELRNIEDTILSAQTEIKTLTSQIEQAKIKLESLEDPVVYDDLVIRAKEKIEQLTSQLNGYREKLKEQKDIVDTYTAKKQQIESSIQIEMNEDKYSYLEVKGEYENKRTALLSQVSQLKREIEEAKAIKDTCPTCGRKFEDVFIPDTSVQEGEIVSLNTRIKNINDHLAELSSLHSKSQIAFQEELTAATKDTVLKINEAKAHCQNYERAIINTQNDITAEERSLARYEQYKASYLATFETLNATINNNENQIKNINEKFVYYNEDKVNVETRLGIIQKFITLTTRDFRGYLLKNVIQYIDTKAKEYCEDIFETRNIDFLLDGNNIEIKYCGKQYEACSGGEKQKIDIIVQFAIRDMLCQFLDFRSSILVLDEIFDNIDSTGCDKVIDLISKKLTDISSIFIITHHSDLQIPEDSCITVTKFSNGVSEVK